MSSPTEIQAADVRAPSGASAPTAEQQLADTGTTESHNAVGLTVGEFASIVVGAEAIRVKFAAAAELAAQVSATSMLLIPGSHYRWLVCPRDAFVYAEAADGVSAYEASVWTSSGPRAGE